MTEEAAPRGDDFKQIAGIGPAFERRLHEVGILTYYQLATTSPAELAEKLQNFAGISASRIEEQGWTAKARELAPPQQEPANEPQGGSGNGQHYATFNIELLLDESSEVRRTRAVYIQGGEKKSWAGWDRERLLRFLEERAAIDAGLEQPAASDEPVAVNARAEERARKRKLEAPPASMRSTLDVSQSYELRNDELNLANAKIGRSEAGQPQQLRKPTSLRFEEYPEPLGQLQLIPAGEQQPQRVLRHGEPFSVHLSLDLRERPLARRSVDYSATLFAQTAGSDESQSVGEAQGTLDAGETDITFTAQIATPGTYRVEAQLTIAGASTTSTTHIVRGKIIHVY